MWAMMVVPRLVCILPHEWPPIFMDDARGPHMHDWAIILLGGGQTGQEQHIPAELPHRRNISWRRRMSLAVSRTNLADSCHPRLSTSSALRSARARPDSMSSSMVYDGGMTVLNKLHRSGISATTEYERLVNEKQRLEKLHLQTVEEQEVALMEGEKVKAAIRARLGEIDRRLAGISGA